MCMFAYECVYKINIHKEFSLPVVHSTVSEWKHVQCCNALITATHCQQYHSLKSIYKQS